MAAARVKNSAMTDKLLVAVTGHQLAHRSRYPGVRWGEIMLRILDERLDDDGAAIRGMTLTVDVAAALQAVDEAVMAPVVSPVSSANRPAVSGPLRMRMSSVSRSVALMPYAIGDSLAEEH